MPTFSKLLYQPTLRPFMCTNYKITFQKHLDNTENVEENFTSYMQGFSPNVQNITEKLTLDRYIAKMSNPRYNIFHIVLNERAIHKKISIRIRP